MEIEQTDEAAKEDNEAGRRGQREARRSKRGTERSFLSSARKYFVYGCGCFFPAGIYLRALLRVETSNSSLIVERLSAADRRIANGTSAGKKRGERAEFPGTALILLIRAAIPPLSRPLLQ